MIGHDESIWLSSAEIDVSDKPRLFLFSRA